MSDEKKAMADRRDFLRKVGIGAVGAGATLMIQGNEQESDRVGINRNG